MQDRRRRNRSDRVARERRTPARTQYRPTNRGADSADGPVALLACRVRVPFPPGPWVQRFTASHPDVVVEVLSRMELAEGRALMEARLKSPDALGWVDEIRHLPGVSQVELLKGPGPWARVRVVHRHSPFLPIFQKFQLMHRFPFPVENGVATWILVGPEDRVRSFLHTLRAKVPGVAIDSVRHDDAEGEGLLTVRQREIFRSALRAGYFEVPRRTTLTELAAQLSMAISSLSEALAIIERKLLAGRPED